MSIKLKVHKRVVGGQDVLLYQWRGNTTAVDVYRDGVLIATVDADVDNYQISCNPNQTYTCQVCEMWTQNCSNTVVV